MKNQVLVNLVMKCVSEFLSNYNSKWAQAAESNQAEEVDGSLPRNVFPNKTAGPHYTLMSLKTPHCTSIFSSGPIMRSHPLPPSRLLSFSYHHHHLLILHHFPGWEIIHVVCCFIKFMENSKAFFLKKKKIWMDIEPTDYFEIQTCATCFWMVPQNIKKRRNK